MMLNQIEKKKQMDIFFFMNILVLNILYNIII